MRNSLRIDYFRLIVSLISFISGSLRRPGLLLRIFITITFDRKNIRIGTSAILLYLFEPLIR